MDNSQLSTALPKGETGAAYFLGAAVFIGILFNYLFFEKVPGISFPVFWAAVVAVFWHLCIRNGRKISASFAATALALMLFASMLALRTSPFLMLLNVAVSVFLSLVLLKISLGERPVHFGIADYIKTLFTPFQFVAPFFSILPEAFQWPKALGRNESSSAILRGIIIALPILFVFGFLFASADLIFEKYIARIVDIHIDPEIAARILLIAIVSAAFLGAFAFAFRILPAKSNEPSPVEAPKGYRSVESLVVLTLVNILFLAFIAIQIAYLFGGESGITLQGFTYADYARRGFFELVAAAVFSFLLLWVIEVYRSFSPRGHAVRVLSGVLVAEVFVVMASALKRLALYEEAYGFTLDRLYAHALIFWLGAVFILLLYKIFIDRREHVFAFLACMSFLLGIAAMNVFNPEFFIAEKNIQLYQKTGRIDIAYLSGLSYDALPSVVKALDMGMEEEKQYLAHELHRALWQVETSEMYTQWQSWNLSRKRAQEALAAHRDYLEKNKDLEFSSF